MASYDFCRYRKACPYLGNLSAEWMFGAYQRWHNEQKELWRDVDFKYDLLVENRKYIEKLEKENQDLKAKLKALQGKLFKSNRKQKKQSSENEDENKSTPEKKRKRGAPKGHPGWYRRKPDHIDKAIIVDAPDVCPHCSYTDLTPIHEMKDHLQEDIVLQPLTHVTNFKHHQAFCPKCNRPVIKTDKGELANCAIGPVTKAAAVFLRYGLRIPYRKVQELFDVFFNMPFVPASAMAFDRKATVLGEPLYNNLKEKLRATVAAHADETYWREDGINHYVWYGGNNKLAYFHIDRHRSSEVATSIFGDRYDGVLQTDGYAAYNAVNPKARQACLAHLIRNSEEIKQEILLKKSSYQDKKSIQFCDYVTSLLKKACKIAHKFINGEIPREKANLYNRRFYSALNSICIKNLADTKAETFRQRLLNPKKEYNRLFTFLHYPDVQPTNNQAEQSLRNMVIFRKICFGTRSQEGSFSHSVLPSLLLTAKRQGKHPLKFFKTLFTSDADLAYTALYNDSS